MKTESEKEESKMDARLKKARWCESFFAVGGGVCIFVLILLIWNMGWAWFQTNTLLTNLTNFVGGTMIFGMYFFSGLTSAMSGWAIWDYEYLRRKRRLQWAVGLLGLLVIGSVLFHFLHGPILSSSPMNWAQMPGVIFVLVVLLINPLIWELFWLKRLGKVKKMEANHE